MSLKLFGHIHRLHGSARLFGRAFRAELMDGICQRAHLSAKHSGACREKVDTGFFEKKTRENKNLEPVRVTNSIRHALAIKSR